MRTGSHGATDLSPVSLSAAVHLDVTVPNFGIQEYMEHSPLTHEVFHTSYEFHEGALHPSSAPGLGVELDEEAAVRFPYNPKYLPVGRRTDGSVHDW